MITAPITYLEISTCVVFPQKCRPPPISQSQDTDLASRDNTDLKSAEKMTHQPDYN